MRPKDELYLKAVARLKRSNDDLEQIVRAILLNPTLRQAAREEYCDLERWEEDMVASAACRRAVTDIEAILEWPEEVQLAESRGTIVDLNKIRDWLFGRAQMRQDRNEWQASFEDLYLSTAIFRGDFSPDETLAKMVEE
jgi:hypothetical protein